MHVRTMSDVQRKLVRQVVVQTKKICTGENMFAGAGMFSPLEFDGVQEGNWTVFGQGGLNISKKLFGTI